MIPAAVIFLLFFAILAFAWFYLQRAKSRNAANTTTASQSDAASSPTDPAP
jgi:hypothetical protein